MDDDDPLGPKDFEDDSVRTLSKLVQTAQLTLERIQLCGIQVGREPLESIHDSSGDRRIESLELFCGRL